MPCKGRPVTLKVKLKWPGRYGQVERAGLPARPPGKMFRADRGIPIRKEPKIVRAYLSTGATAPIGKTPGSGLRSTDKSFRAGVAVGGGVVYLIFAFI